MIQISEARKNFAYITSGLFLAFVAGAVVYVPGKAVLGYVGTVIAAVFS
jgi:hypothetical protein